MDFLSLKAIHIIFIVNWFAGLFYIVRLFVYHAESVEKNEPEKTILQKQYKLMEKRLWIIITWPSAIITSIFGFWMLYKNPSYLQQPWMHIKLTFVLCLYIYHGYCHIVYKQLQKNIIKFTPMRFRILNEVSTVILIAVVFLVVAQNSLNWIYGVLGIIGISVALMFAIKGYKKMREKRGWDK